MTALRESSKSNSSDARIDLTAITWEDFEVKYLRLDR